MKQFRKIMLLALGFGLLTAVLSYIPTRPAAAAASAPVFVTNTGAAQAIPVSPQGTTPVSGTVSATQSGTWNVGITGNSRINPFFVRDLDNIARGDPFSIGVPCFIGNQAGCNSSSTSLSTKIPPGKRLIVTLVSGRVDQLSSGIRAFQEITISDATGDVRYDLSPPLVFQGTLGQGDMLVSETPVHLIIERDDTLEVGCILTGTSVNGRCQSRLSGYLVDRP